MSSYSFTTEAIAVHAREGEIIDAIESAYADHNKKGAHDDAAIAVGAAKRLAIGTVSVLGPDVASYTVSVSGHTGSRRTKPSFSVAITAVEYADPNEGDDEEAAVE